MRGVSGGCWRAYVKVDGMEWRPAGFKRPSEEEALRDLVQWLKRRGFDSQGAEEWFR